MVNKWLGYKDYRIKYKNLKMYFISECTLFRNRIKYIFKLLHFGYVPQNGKCISLYNHRIYSPVCRYKTHEAGHGNARGRPHLSIFGNRDADDFRTCQDVDTVWLIL